MRKPFLDNLRYSIVLLVILYHVFYLFNSVGVITNVDIPGIPVLDAVLYVLYPWFMVTLFVISGICARYSLQKQTNKEFLKSKEGRAMMWRVHEQSAQNTVEENIFSIFFGFDEK
mgnify:CR=1 FL=1